VPITSWQAFLYVILYYMILERRAEAFKTHEARLERVSGIIALEQEDGPVAVEAQVADWRQRIDELLANPEVDPEWEPTADPRFWRFVDEELPKVSDEKCRECFRKFAKLVFREGLSRQEAWRQVKPTCHGHRWATFNRWMNKLRVTLMRRWLEERQS